MGKNHRLCKSISIGHETGAPSDRFSLSHLYSMVLSCSNLDLAKVLIQIQQKNLNSCSFQALVRIVNEWTLCSLIKSVSLTFLKSSKMVIFWCSVRTIHLHFVLLVEKKRSVYWYLAGIRCHKCRMYKISKDSLLML